MIFKDAKVCIRYRNYNSWGGSHFQGIKFLFLELDHVLIFCFPMQSFSIGFFFPQWQYIMIKQFFTEAFFYKLSKNTQARARESQYGI